MEADTLVKNNGKPLQKMSEFLGNFFQWIEDHLHIHTNFCISMPIFVCTMDILKSKYLFVYALVLIARAAACIFFSTPPEVSGSVMGAFHYLCRVQILPTAWRTSFAGRCTAGRGWKTYAPCLSLSFLQCCALLGNGR